MSEKYNIQGENSLDSMEGLLEDGSGKNSINIQEIREIKDIISKSFISEKINISEDNVTDFVKAVGDINPIHFNKDEIGNSVFSEESEGRIFVPGMYTQSLWTNSKCIHEAISIKEPHEIILKGIQDVKFTYPVFAESDLIYKFTVVDATDIKVKGRNAVEVTFKVTASTVIKGKTRPCMLLRAQVIYCSMRN